MNKRTWLLRCCVMMLTLLLTNALVAVKLIRAFDIARAGLFVGCYAAGIGLIVARFRRIRSRSPYIIKCIGAYGIGLYIALSMAAAAACVIPLPGWLMVLLAFGLALYGFNHAEKIYVNHYHVPILPQSIRLVLISDVHIGSVRSEERLPKLIRRINEQKPDLVCIAGDLIDNCFEAVRDPERAAALFRSIQSTYGIYACLGNHDAGKSAAEMEAFMAEAGIVLLKEEYAEVGPITLLGRLDGKPHGNYVNSSRRDTEMLLAEKPQNDLPLVVLDHNPAVIPQYDDRSSLLLCGHTHNGQIFPGNLVIRAINICGYGHYKGADTPHVVVSSGAGTWGPPMRIGTNCEIAIVELGT